MASLDYISGPHDTPCICKHDGLHWIRKCKAAQVADDATAARWAADNIRAHPERQFTEAYLEQARPYMNEDLR